MPRDFYVICVGYLSQYFLEPWNNNNRITFPGQRDLQESTALLSVGDRSSHSHINGPHWVPLILRNSGSISRNIRVIVTLRQWFRGQIFPEYSFMCQ